MTKNTSYFKNRDKEFIVENKKNFASLPRNALVEVTNACNHACVFCYNPRMKRKIKTLPLETFEKFVKNASVSGLEEVGLYSTGEPFMTKNIYQYVAIAKKNKLKRIYITTNGALAKISSVAKCIEEGLSSIKFSINAATRENYKIIHGYDDFEKVFKNVEDIRNYIIKNKLETQMLCSFVYTNLTEKEVGMFRAKFSKYFEDIQFIKAHNQSGALVNENKALTQSVETEPEVEFKYKPCEMLWNRIHLTAEGYLTACCTDYENNLIYEKFKEEVDLLEQFNNSKIKNLRKRHLENNLDGLLCKSCIYNKDYEYEPISNFNTEFTKVNLKKFQSLNDRIKKI